MINRLKDAKIVALWSNDICDPKSKNRPYGARNFRLMVHL